MARLSRYNPKKRGSFKISMTFYDWELSNVIGALTRMIELVEKNPNPKFTAWRRKAYITFLTRLRAKFKNALSLVLKAELRDLKLKKGQTDIAPTKSKRTMMKCECGGSMVEYFLAYSDRPYKLVCNRCGNTWEIT